MEIFFAVISSFLLSLCAISVLRPFAVKFELVDKPNERKQHLGHVPLIGGIAVFCSVVISSSMWLPVNVELVSYLCAAGLMVVLGVMDDKHDLSVKFRVFFQIIIATFMIFTIDDYIVSLGNLFFIGEIKLGYVGLLFTYIAVVAMINAFNMVDGIDGLLGAMAINTLGAIAFLLFIKGQENLFTVLIIVALIPYLIFNLGFFGTRYRKIFMGDAGSMFIGFTVVWLLVSNTQGASISFRPVTALWIVAVPLIDMATIIIRRIKKGQSPFHADREHLHHIFLRAGFSSRSALCIIFCLSAVFSTIAIVSEWYAIHESIMFAGFLCVFGVYSFVMLRIWHVVKFVRRFRVKLRRQKRRV
ncbi:UDP-N-acetylglucosamine--undecaprenyl-phosphate N-acetylglucosaminephosphotransferase [Pseudoalteromonas sp. SWXJZ94C]|uniref:UDP-N-acetylglucosamine--undecaprenyl-phosphate N-acetylglucosaminephosphotransferase n=1 Tax=unclassified Pseudoalteromonas TaxID=194690 RepID=UPI00140813A2|nr:UDP-N-acetylglucosamine--undecaprenyl-phosphate N-acetylglucosaminephosphotransferase [Pseudoalteromonas sp. SWXJZ94C]